MGFVKTAMTERAMAVGERATAARVARRLGAMLVLAAVAGAGGARAADHPGKAVYEQYCASCHGPAADGNGPVAAEMKISPADLRKLGQKYGMPLPKPKLREFVDGREMVRSHGTSNMPVWGEDLVRNAPPTANVELFKRGTMVVILDYLETLQIPASK